MNQAMKGWLHGGRVYAVIAAVVTVSFLIVEPVVRVSAALGGRVALDQVAVRVLMAAALLIIAGLLLRGDTTPTDTRILHALVGSGIVMRIGYMLYTSYSVRAHDVDTLNDSGHLRYIYTILTQLRLPDSNAGQFYHPPLSHILEALAVRVYSVLSPGSGLNEWFEGAKLVPAFASCATLIVCLRLFEELGVDRRTKLAAMTLLAFHPTFFILASSINNDMLMIFFFMAALLYTVRWYHRPTMRHILTLAVLIGCAMSAKFSGALVAVITAAAFLVMLLRRRGKRPSLPRLFGQFAAFGAVCLPLGLWYPVRNWILFRQPLGYVLPLSVNSYLYVGYRSLWQRFGLFSPTQLFTVPYCQVRSDYQLWIYTIKCSVFGEYWYSWYLRALATLLVAVNALLILWSLAAMVVGTVRRRSPGAWMFTGLWGVMMASFVYFNIKYPFACTMDYRYIVPTCVVGAAFLGDSFSALRGSRHPAARLAARAEECLILVFCTLSVAFYVL